MVPQALTCHKQFPTEHSRHLTNVIPVSLCLHPITVYGYQKLLVGFNVVVSYAITFEIEQHLSCLNHSHTPYACRLHAHKETSGSSSPLLLTAFLYYFVSVARETFFPILVQVLPILYTLRSHQPCDTCFPHKSNSLGYLPALSFTRNYRMSLSSSRTLPATNPCGSFTIATVGNIPSP